MMRANSAVRSGGTSSAIGRPITSSALYPKSRSAPGFQLTMVPSTDLPTMASSEAWIMEARCETISSDRLRPVMSRMKAETNVPRQFAGG